MSNNKIAIIDSGISENVEFADKILASYVLEIGGEKILPEKFSHDYIGHGTAVADIIHQIDPLVDFISFRICNAEMEVDEKGLVRVLEYIYNNIDVALINISAGITYTYHYEELRNICNKLYKDKGVIIVSAFDNDGVISYPAALDEVIGVDVKKNYVSKEDIYYVENSIVDILVPDIFYRTVWDDKRTIIRGTSFATACVTGMISKVMGNIPNLDKKNVVKKISNMMYKFSDYQKISGPEFKIRKAIIFPINKESKTLLRYKSMLGFEIAGAYDERVSGNVGRVLYDEEVKPFDIIEWESDFDTIILSCTNELSRITRRRYSDEIVELAKKYNKYIYTFEKIESEYTNIFYPEITSSMVVKKNNLKLNRTTMPIVGVFGTSSRQGKFSLQLEMINYFRKLGYNVGHVATEPSGYLFDADYVFHFGYHSYLKIQPWESVVILNNMIWETQIKGKDILFTGCQSGTLHYRDCSVEDFAIYQYAFFLGIMPDLIVLCVNPHDEIDYIERTINFINSIGEGKVYALAIFPIKAVESKSGVKYKTEEISFKNLEEYKQKYKNLFKLPTYIIGNNEDLNALCRQIISYFSS